MQRALVTIQTLHGEIHSSALTLPVRAMWRLALQLILTLCVSELGSVKHFVQSQDGTYPDFGHSYRTTGHIADSAALKVCSFCGFCVQF